MWGLAPMCFFQMLEWFLSVANLELQLLRCYNHYNREIGGRMGRMGRMGLRKARRRGGNQEKGGFRASNNHIAFRTTPLRINHAGYRLVLCLGVAILALANVRVQPQQAGRWNLPCKFHIWHVDMGSVGLLTVHYSRHMLNILLCTTYYVQHTNCQNGLWLALL